MGAGAIETSDAFVQPVCEGLLGRWVDELARATLAGKRLGFVPGEFDLLVQIGSKQAEDALEAIARQITPRIAGTAKALAAGEYILPDHYLLYARDNAIASLARLNPARARAVVAGMSKDAPVTQFHPFLEVAFAPPPNIYQLDLILQPYRQSHPESTVIIPELVIQAKKMVEVGGFDSDGALDYLMAAAPADALRMMRWLVSSPVSRRRPLERAVFSGDSETHRSRRSGYEAELLASEVFRQFEALHRAVNLGLLDEDTLTILAKDRQDRDRQFWGVYGVALKGRADYKAALSKKAKTEIRQWRWLVVAALAALGDKDAAKVVSETAAGGSIAEKAFLAYSLTSVYREGMGVTQKRLFKESLSRLATDECMLVAMFTCDRAYFLPPAAASDLLADAILGYRALPSDDGTVPPELLSLSGSPDDPSMGLYLLRLMGATDRFDQLAASCPAALPAIRRVLLSGDEDNSGYMMGAVLIEVGEDSEAWPEYEYDTPLQHALCLAALAAAGEDAAADELRSLLDGGLELPDAVIAHMRKPQLLPYLRAIILRHAKDSSPPSFVTQAAMSYLVALGRARQIETAIQGDNK